MNYKIIENYDSNDIAIIEYENGKQAYIKKDGSLSKEFKKCYGFRNDIGFIEIDDNNFAFINTDFKISNFYNMYYVYSADFSNNYTRIKKDSRYGFLDKNFNEIDVIYDNISCNGNKIYTAILKDEITLFDLKLNKIKTFTNVKKYNYVKGKLEITYKSDFIYEVDDLIKEFNNNNKTDLIYKNK